MTKFHFRKKTERKIIKKRRIEKYNFINDEDIETSSIVSNEIRFRMPTKQQYIRSKNKTFIQQYGQKFSKSKSLSNIEKENVYRIEPFPSENKSNLPKLDGSPTKSIDHFNDESNISVFSFSMQQDWSDFEENDQIKFLSDEDFNCSSVYHILDEHKAFDIEQLDEFSFINDRSVSYSSSWVAEASDDRLTQVTCSINDIEQAILSNYQSLFKIPANSTVWMNTLTEINSILSLCESNKNSIQELMMKDQTFELQEKCFEWTNMAIKCCGIRSCLEIIRDSEIMKENFQIALEILHDQSCDLLNHSIIYPGRLLMKISHGAKKICVALKDQYKRIEISLRELFPEHCDWDIALIDQLTDDIRCLDKLSWRQAKSSVLLESVRNILSKYLDRKSELISIGDSVLNYCF